MALGVTLGWYTLDGRGLKKYETSGIWGWILHLGVPELLEHILELHCETHGRAMRE